MKVKIFLFFILILFIVENVYSQKLPEKKTRILFLLDASASMLSPWQSSNRFVIAKKVLSALVDSIQLDGQTEIGLRVFGSQSALTLNDCKDSKLEVPIKLNSSTLIKNKLNSLQARGITPIAYSLSQCGKDFGLNTGNTRNIIIVVTDGIESCEGDPCEIALDLQKKGIILRPLVVGMGITPELAKAFDCLGKYTEAENEKKFKSVMNDIINTVLKNTTAQVNLLDINGKESESNLDMIFYDKITGAVRYNLIHTMNVRGKPDTLHLDPINTYDLVVYSTPPVEKKNVEIIANKHNEINISTPQGSLAFMVNGNNAVYKNLQAVIREKGKKETLAVLEINNSKKLLVGNYDLEILTIPRINIDIKIKQSELTNIQIPPPGIITLLNANNVPILATLYKEEGFDLNLIYTLNGNSSSETVNLQPGNYRIVYKIKGSKKAMSTKELKFKITSGSSEVLKLF